MVNKAEKNHSSLMIISGQLIAFHVYAYIVHNMYTHNIRTIFSFVLYYIIV